MNSFFTGATPVKTGFGTKLSQLVVTLAVPKAAEGGAEAEEAEAGPTNHPEVQVENLLQLEDASDWDAMMGGDSFSLEDDSKALGAELDAAILALRQPGKENIQ